jgi:hypothetical protein
MLEIIRTTSTPASREADLFISNWKKVLFFFHRRVFLSGVEDILNAVAGHENNSLPAGDYQYQVLSARADALCTEFAERWDLDQDLLRARIPGLAKLAGLSMPPPTKNYARLAWLVLITAPLALFILGILAGLVSVGFHLVGGR